MVPQGRTVSLLPSRQSRQLPGPGVQVMITLKLTDKEAEVLYTVLRYQHLGEYDGGPLGDSDARAESQNIAAAHRIQTKLEAAIAQAKGAK